MKNKKPRELIQFYIAPEEYQVEGGNKVALGCNVYHPHEDIPAEFEKDKCALVKLEDYDQAIAQLRKACAALRLIKENAGPSYDKEFDTDASIAEQTLEEIKESGVLGE